MDNSLNESILISKVNNMVKLIYNSITLNKLEDVKNPLTSNHNVILVIPIILITIAL